MSRLLRFISVGAAALVLCMAGCSQEASTPPAAGGIADASTSFPAKSFNALPDREMSPGATANATATVPDTPEGAMRALLDGWGDDNSEAIWNMLPASYQRDVNDLVNTTARRLHPEAWRWFLKTMQKGAAQFQKQAEELTAMSPSDDSDAETPPPAEMNPDTKFTAEGCAFLGSLLAAVGAAGPETLEELKTADVGRLLRGKGRSLLGQFRKMVQGALEDEIFVAGFLPAVDPSQIRVVPKGVSGEFATVELVYGEDNTEEVAASEREANPAVKLLMGLIGGPAQDNTRLKVSLVRVEGKWIPRWLANRWSMTISTIKSAVLEAMPSESPRENFGKPFQILTALDTQLQLWETPRDDSHEAPPVPFWFLLISPDLGPADLVNELTTLLVEGFLDDEGYEEMSAPAIRVNHGPSCEFQRLTHKALDDVGKRVVVLCGSTAEIREAYPAVEADAVEHVSKALQRQQVDAAEPERVAEWTKTSGGLAEGADLAAIAGEFTADYLVLIRFEHFACRAEGGEKWRRGNARGTLSVAELVPDEGHPDKSGARVIYTRSFESRYPAHLPASVDDEPEEKFQERFLHDLLESLSRLLYNAGDETAPVKG